MRLHVFALLVFVLPLPGFAGGSEFPDAANAVWQWSAPVATAAPGKASSARAFLWIPAGCQRVRAVVFAQNNMIEEGILTHRDFRKALGELGIAELYVAPFFDYWQDATNNDSANQRLNHLLKSLASESGYAELETAPIIPMGHSASASMPWNFAAWNSDRTLAILSLKGDAPNTHLVGNGRPNVDWGPRHVDGIPSLMVMSEYEWWEDRLSPALAFRARNAEAPFALLCDEGHGHFDYSDRLVRYLAVFVRKAADARLPKGGSSSLKPVRASSGWLIDRWRTNGVPRAQAAKFANFKGDRSDAFWCFDREMARETERFNPQFGKEPQLVTFVQNGKVLDQTLNTAEQVRISVPPLDDRLTFHLRGGFYDFVPAGGNPAKWAGLTNGAPLRHAKGGVMLSRIVGPVEQLSPQNFAIRFNRSTVPGDPRAGDIWLLASHTGDGKFRSAVQQGLMRIPLKLTEGAAQKIGFPEIADVRSGVKTVKLEATSDSGATVYYFVREGPALVHNGELRFTPPPPRAKLPIRVTVVAWQYGRTVDPKLQSAEPVERSFFILP